MSPFNHHLDEFDDAPFDMCEVMDEMNNMLDKNWENDIQQWYVSAQSSQA